MFAHSEYTVIKIGWATKDLPWITHTTHIEQDNITDKLTDTVANDENTVIQTGWVTKELPWMRHTTHIELEHNKVLKVI